MKPVSVAFACLLVACFVPAALRAQNSTAKIRAQPSESAAGVGAAVPWRKDVAAALAEAKERGKPVFWYVPSIARSPMDRKPELDRYLMGGPFSWPSTIELLREHFVPVKQIGGGDELSEALGLKRNTFIEPGYVVLDPAGKQVLLVDQLTTLHPQWFEAPLRRIVQQPIQSWPGHPGLAEAWAAFRRGDLQQAADLCPLPKPDEAPSGLVAERLWLGGVARFRLGDRAGAERHWRAIVAGTPDSPWACKAALELEGHGPFVHGFEVYGELPPAVLESDPHDGTRAPAGVYDEAELWRRSVTFLVGAHDGDGVFRDSTYDFGGTDGLPNVHAAVTCLVGEALLAATARAAAGRLELPPATVRCAEALLLRLREQAMRSDWLSLSDRDEILWARAYAVRFLGAWSARRSGDAEAVAPGVRGGVAALLALQQETGVWFHEYGNPFAIATALQALHVAKQVGCEVQQDAIDRGLRALVKNRADDGAFSYSQTRDGRRPRAKVPAAAGRMPLCELGLYLHGGSDQERLAAAVAAGEAHHALLAEVRKYDDHASRLGYGGFFFWFDMLGRAEAIAQLDDAELRRERAAALRETVRSLPEFDGCFVDSHELGRCYGTAMALLCLEVLGAAIGG